MNRFSNLGLASIAVVLLLIGLSVPINASTSSTLPTEIAGCPVIYVETPSNTVGMNPGTETLVILNNAAKTGDSAENLANLDSNLNITGYIEQNPLPKGCSIEVYGGTGASKAEFEQVHQQINQQLKTLGPLNVTSQPSTSTFSRQPLTGDPYPTFAIVTDVT